MESILYNQYLGLPTVFPRGPLEIQNGYGSADKYIDGQKIMNQVIPPVAPSVTLSLVGVLKWGIGGTNHLIASPGTVKYNGYIAYYENIPLSSDKLNAGFAFWYNLTQLANGTTLGNTPENTNILRQVIPANFDPAGSYQYHVFINGNPTNPGDYTYPWNFDTNAGILTFTGKNKVNLPVTMTYWRYEGTFGIPSVANTFPIISNGLYNTSAVLTSYPSTLNPVNNTFTVSGINGTILGSIQYIGGNYNKAYQAFSTIYDYSQTDSLGSMLSIDGTNPFSSHLGGSYFYISVTLSSNILVSQFTVNHGNDTANDTTRLVLLGQDGINFTTLYNNTVSFNNNTVKTIQILPPVSCRTYYLCFPHQPYQWINNFQLFTGTPAVITNIPLTPTTTYFNITQDTSRTLGDGQDGQLKILLVTGITSGSTLTISVPSSGWPNQFVNERNCIIFNYSGSGCILQYVDSHWYCIGSNGQVIFS